MLRIARAVSLSDISAEGWLVTWNSSNLFYDASFRLAGKQSNHEAIMGTRFSIHRVDILKRTGIHLFSYALYALIFVLVLAEIKAVILFELLSK